MNTARHRPPIPRSLLIGTIALALIGPFQARSLEQMASYAVVLVAALAPTFMWFRIGAPSIPILPVVSMAYIPYYAWPILSTSQNLFSFTDWEILRAALTIALYLFAAMIGWRMLIRPARAGNGPTAQNPIDHRVVRVVSAGLVVGIIYEIALITGWLYWTGPFFGVARAAAVTLATIACFLTGAARAQRLLRGRAWAAALTALGALVVLTWTSLFLIGGIVYLLAVLFGHVIVTRRVPWHWAIASFVVLAILHAGKAEMRAKYWEAQSNYSASLSITDLPGFTKEWLADGIAAIRDGDSDTGLINRASLLQIVLRVQRATPDRIDYLGGETYSLVPRTLVPRFVDPNKPTSQAAMDLLNVRYGVLTLQNTEVTAVGWGLVAEAFANFGYLGVVMIGVLFGVFCALLSNASARANIVSRVMLLSIATMMVLINVEADSVTLCSTLLQTAIAIIAVDQAYKSLALRPASNDTASTALLANSGAGVVSTHTP